MFAVKKNHSVQSSQSTVNLALFYVFVCLAKLPCLPRLERLAPNKTAKFYKQLLAGKDTDDAPVQASLSSSQGRGAHEDVSFIAAPKPRERKRKEKKDEVRLDASIGKVIASSVPTADEDEAGNCAEEQGEEEDHDSADDPSLSSSQGRGAHEDVSFIAAPKPRERKRKEKKDEVRLDASIGKVIASSVPTADEDEAGNCAEEQGEEEDHDSADDPVVEVEDGERHNPEHADADMNEVPSTANNDAPAAAAPAPVPNEEVPAAAASGSEVLAPEAEETGPGEHPAEVPPAALPAGDGQRAVAEAFERRSGGPRRMDSHPKSFWFGCCRIRFRDDRSALYPNRICSWLAECPFHSGATQCMKTIQINQPDEETSLRRILQWCLDGRQYRSRGET